MSQNDPQREPSDRRSNVHWEPPVTCRDGLAAILGTEDLAQALRSYVCRALRRSPCDGLSLDEYDRLFAEAVEKLLNKSTLERRFTCLSAEVSADRCGALAPYVARAAIRVGIDEWRRQKREDSRRGKLVERQKNLEKAPQPGEFDGEAREMLTAFRTKLDRLLADARNVLSPRMWNAFLGRVLPRWPAPLGNPPDCQEGVPPAGNRATRRSDVFRARREIVAILPRYSFDEQERSWLLALGIIVKRRPPGRKGGT